jgi:hypothetical protein
MGITSEARHKAKASGMSASASIGALPVREVAHPDECLPTAKLLRYCRGVFHREGDDAA